VDIAIVLSVTLTYSIKV